MLPLNIACNILPPHCCAVYSAANKSATTPLPLFPTYGGATHVGRTAIAIPRCSSPQLGSDSHFVGGSDQGLLRDARFSEDSRSDEGFLFSTLGWNAVRVNHDDLDMLKKFSHVQADAFYVPFPFFDDFFFSIFKAEVLSSLLYKIRHATPKRYACIVAMPGCQQSEDKEIVGVVDAAAMADRHVLKALPGIDEYLYISGMAVVPKYRRQKVATVLLQACDATAIEWGFEYLVLQAYEDDKAARLLYAKAGYVVIAIDPLWFSRLLGRRRKVILAKKVSASVYNKTPSM